MTIDFDTKSDAIKRSITFDKTEKKVLEILIAK